MSIHLADCRIPAAFTSSALKPPSPGIGAGVQRVRIQIVRDHIGHANGFADKLERAHGAQRHQRHQQTERQMHAPGPDQRKQRQRKRHGQQHNGEHGEVRAVGMGPRALAHTSAGILRMYHHPSSRQNRQGGHNPQRAPAHDARLEGSVLLHARGDQRVNSRQRQGNGGAKRQRRKVGGIEKALPELVVL